MPDEDVRDRIARMEGRMIEHFDTVERDRKTRRDNERSIANRISDLEEATSKRLDKLEEAFSQFTTRFETARASGKLVLAVAVAFGGLVSWIVNLYTTFKK